MSALMYINLFLCAFLLAHNVIAMDEEFIVICPDPIKKSNKPFDFQLRNESSAHVQVNLRDMNQKNLVNKFSSEGKQILIQDKSIILEPYQDCCWASINEELLFPLQLVIGKDGSELPSLHYIDLPENHATFVFDKNEHICCQINRKQ